MKLNQKNGDKRNGETHNKNIKKSITKNSAKNEILNQEEEDQPKAIDNNRNKYLKEKKPTRKECQ